MEEKKIKELQESLLPYLKHEKKRDLCPVYKNVALMHELLSFLAEPFRGKVEYVAAPESIGFVLGSMLAQELGVGFVPIRNADLSYVEEEDRLVSSYIDHNNRVKTMHVRVSNFPKGGRILLVDEWIDTGATIHTCKVIVEEGEGIVEGIAAIGVNRNEKTADMLDAGKIHCAITV